MSANGELRIGVGPFRVRLRASPPGWVRHLSAVVGSAPPPPDAIPIDISLRRQRDGACLLRTPAGDRRLGAPWLCGALVQGVLLQAVAQAAPRAVRLHSAALLGPSGAVLLPAVSGTGKSTAALALAAAGWRCLSDDLAFWSPHNGLVSGTDFAISLKHEAPAVLRRRLAGFELHKARYRAPDGRFAVLYGYHPPPTALPWRGPLQAIGFLARGPRAVRTLTAGEALTRLWPLRVRHLVDDQPGADIPSDPAAIASALRGVQIAEIRTPRIADVVPTVQGWLAGQPSGA